MRIGAEAADNRRIGAEPPDGVVDMLQDRRDAAIAAQEVRDA
jgi:hypothetical protein